MSSIIDGKFVPNEMSLNAKGGTELVAERLISALSPELLKGYQIVFSRVRETSNKHDLIYFCHDLASDHESQVLSNSLFRARLRKIVFVSNWQAQMFQQRYNLRYDEYVVIENPINPITFVDKPTGPINLIYHTTPHRGLVLLYPIFEELLKKYDITLDVFSSFNIYGWGQRDEEFKQVFDLCKNHPKIRYHGFQPNSIVRKALTESHVFCYPNIWPETSCLAMIEALAAGCSVIHPNFGALFETACGRTNMCQMSENSLTLMNRIYTLTALQIEQWMANASSMNDQMREQSQFFNRRHSLGVIAGKWVQLLSELKTSKKSAQA